MNIIEHLEVHIDSVMNFEEFQDYMSKNIRPLIFNGLIMLLM